MNKLSEDRTISQLIEYCKSQNGQINDDCLSQQRGIDIVAENPNGKSLIIEVKGAKASDNSPNKKGQYIDIEQIKDHFEKAIVKSLESQSRRPDASIVSAYTNNLNIFRHIQKVTSILIDTGFLFISVYEFAGTTDWTTSISKSIIYDIDRTLTRFHVTENDFDVLRRNPSCKLVIHVVPGMGYHPKGTYEIPNSVALNFINSKRKMYNWSKNKYFRQDGVPKDLKEYFQYQ